MKLNTRFGQYGGVYAPESLVPILTQVEQGFIDIKQDKAFQEQFHHLLQEYAGRPTALTYAENLSQKTGLKIYLKREDLLHGGAHKTNNCIGQLLLAKHLGKHRIIAETGAGQHGVATAMVGAKLGLDVTVYMGAVDVARQAPNVTRMKLFGAKVVPVESGSATLKDAINEAMRDWITYADNTYYCFGTAAGPHPFPSLVRYFQKIISEETRRQIQAQAGGLPDAVIACVGGGSNAIGAFADFIDDEQVQLFGIEAAGKGLKGHEHAATLQKGEPAVFHGMESLFLQDADGQIAEPYSMSAGLDYPGIGPEHAHLRDSGRVQYLGATDDEALDAFRYLSQTEGIIPAFETAHAVAWLLNNVDRFDAGATIVINLSGRGDKDMESYLRIMEQQA